MIWSRTYGFFQSIFCWLYYSRMLTLIAESLVLVHITTGLLQIWLWIWSNTKDLLALPFYTMCFTCFLTYCFSLWKLAFYDYIKFICKLDQVRFATLSNQCHQMFQQMGYRCLVESWNYHCCSRLAKRFLILCCHHTLCSYPVVLCLLRS